MSSVKENSNKLEKSENYFGIDQIGTKAVISSVGFASAYFIIKYGLGSYVKFFSVIPAKYQSEIVQKILSLAHDGYVSYTGLKLLQKSFKEDRLGKEFDSQTSFSLGYYLFDLILCLQQGGKNREVMHHLLLNLPFTYYTLTSGRGRYYYNSFSTSKASNLLTNIVWLAERTGSISNKPTLRTVLLSLQFVVSFLLKLGLVPYHFYHFLKNSSSPFNTRSITIMTILSLFNLKNFIELNEMVNNTEF